ncbi:MAG: TolC family protein [Verrucomicrobia bacterium]|nr:TolC family protein [Verrucomicrobiota bacterium]
MVTARGAENSTPTVALTLDSALQLALENSPVLRAAGGRVEAAAGRVTQAKTWSNPELELVIEDWPLRKNRGYADAKRTIGLSQAVLFPGKRSLSKQIGVAGVKLSAADLALRRVELVREVKIGYFRVLTLERQVEVSVQLLAMADASVAMARKRSDAGAAAYQEQLRAEVLAEQARVEKGDLERERSAARQTFAVLLGRPDLSGARLTDSLIETPAVSLLADFTAGSLAAHPGLQAAQMNLERAELDHRRARLEPYPDLKVGVAAGEVGETGESIGQVSFSLPLPLFDRGKGTRQEARANIVVATAELHSVQQELQRDVTNAVGRYRAASEHVDNYRTRILPKVDEALRLVQAGYEEGKFGFADLVDTQRTTAEVQMTYLTKLFEMSAARAELEALLATPTPKS